jgi:hypothetical protein
VTQPLFFRPGSPFRAAYCGGGLVEGEVVDGSVGRVGGVCPGGVIPSEGGMGAGTVPLPSAGGVVGVGVAVGVVDAASAAASAAASVFGVVSSPEQATRANDPATARTVILSFMCEPPAIARRGTPSHDRRRYNRGRLKPFPCS